MTAVTTPQKPAIALRVLKACARVATAAVCAAALHYFMLNRLTVLPDWTADWRQVAMMSSPARDLDPESQPRMPADNRAPAGNEASVTPAMKSGLSSGVATGQPVQEQVKRLALLEIRVIRGRTLLYAGPNRRVVWVGELKTAGADMYAVDWKIVAEGDAYNKITGPYYRSVFTRDQAAGLKSGIIISSRLQGGVE